MTMVDGPGEMPTLLFIPLKQASPTNWSAALVRYIETSYAEDAAKYEPDAQTLDKLREACFDDQTPELATLECFFT